MNIVVFGKRGTGKSYWCKKRIESSILPVVVIDTMREYQDVAEFQAITDEPIRFENFKTRFVPKSLEDDGGEEFERIMLALAALKPEHGVDVYIDEIDFWTSSAFMPGPFANNLRYSRHYKLNLIMTVRNPAEVNRKITALADVFVIFRITEPRYLDYFRPFDSSLPQRIVALQKYEKIVHHV